MVIVKDRLSVPYSKALVTTYRTATGHLVWEDVDRVYRQYEVREKVILRVDITDHLTEGIISKNADLELKRNYLSVMFGLIYTPDIMSEVLKDIYLHDEQFKLFIGNICYFELPKMPHVSLYDYLVASNNLRKKRIEDDIVGRSIMGVNKSFLDSLWYFYFAINDRVDSVCEIPNDFKVEAISYAKKWDCKYPRAI